MKKRILFGAVAAVLVFPAIGGDLHLSNLPALWRFTGGSEFPGAKGTLENRDEALCLAADFSEGGRYVGAVSRGRLPQFRELAFRVKGAGKQVTLRCLDGEGQTHQYTLPLAGNAGEWRQAVWKPERSASHWGGANDGKVRGPLREIALLVHAAELPGKKAEVRFRDITLREAEVREWKFEARPFRLEESFIAPGGTEPFRLQLFSSRDDFTPEELAYFWSDYAGKKVASGRAEYRPGNGGSLLVAPPREPGYYDLTFPELGIRSAVVADRPVSGEPDGFFAMDVALSRGIAPLGEVEEMFRLLRKNNIGWIRDRLTFGALQPEPDRFDFGAAAGRYRLLREAAARTGLRLLDVIHDAPNWNKYPAKLREDRVGDKIAGRYYLRGNNLYPRDLIAAARGFDAITRRFLPAEKAVEVWNEPSSPTFDNSFPVEFVSALTKAVSVRFSLTGNPAAVVGIVYSGPPLQNYNLYIANGLLEYIDAVSYHDYQPAATLEEGVARLREIERESGSPRIGIPYWITEAGMPWANRELRAAPADDRHSASEIAAKAIEFRACGVQRYFAFICRYYSELHKNFGMLDANGAPMRSMAAYTHLVRVLAHKEYLGDLRLPGAVRCRVFGDDRERVACLYTPLRPVAPPAELELPEGVELIRAEGADGRRLAVENKRIPTAVDGVVYLYLKTLPERLLDRNTRAMALCRLARDYRPSPRCRKPVVVQPEYDLTEYFYSGTGIRFNPEGKFRCRVRYNNLSGRPVTVEPALELPPGVVAADFSAAPFELGPEECRVQEFTLTATDGFGVSRYALAKVGDRNGNTTPLAIALHREPSPEYMKTGRLVELNRMEEPSAWRKNSAGKLTIRRDETERAIEFQTSFPVGVDRWSYPEFLIPAGFLNDAFAIGFEVKVTPADQIRQMVLMAVCSDAKEHGPYISITVPAPTGEWEYRSVFLPSHPRPETIRMFRLGVNAFTQEVSVKIRNVKVFYSR